jgi:hypothetical protein
LTKHDLHGVVELAFAASGRGSQSTLDPMPTLTLRSPSGRNFTVLAFRAGDDGWKARFSPDETGSWHWVLRPSGEEAAPAQGSFEVVQADAGNPWRKHGPLTLHPSRRGFAHTDGTPVFWLADTVWAAPAHARMEEWTTYLAHRRAQGFNVVQINSLPQWDASGPPLREPFLTSDGVTDLTRPDPAYFAFLDGIVAAAAAAGMLSAIVVLWFDNTPADNEDWPITVPRRGPFDDATARAFARYLVARYEAFGAVWIACGDSGFRSPRSVALYDAVSEAILAAAARAPMITAHLNGATPPSAELNARSWLDFVVFQSCHFRDSAERARRYAAVARSFVPRRPVLNSEPCYDSLNIMDAAVIGDPSNPEPTAASTGRPQFGRADVRRTCWVSLLSGASAGISYGAHGLWPWHREGQTYGPMHYGLPLDWRHALALESGDDLARLRRFIEKLPWWDLEPVTGLIADRPDAILGCAAAGVDLLVAYLAGPVALKLPERLSGSVAVEWFDPTNGTMSDGESTRGEPVGLVTSPFGEADAVLILRGDLAGTK